MRPTCTLLLGLLLASQSLTASAKETLTVMTAFHEEVFSRFETAFEQQNPDIDLQILWRMPHDALPYLSQPRQGGVDVYWSAAQKNFHALKQQGAWQPLGIDLGGLQDRLGAMPLIDADRLFCVTEMAGYGFAVNPAYLEKHGLPMPKTWQDLADARYQGHLALPVPSKVGFAPMMIDSVLQQYGWQQGWAILAGVVANARLVDSGSTFVSDIIGSGERGIAPTIDFFTASAIANGAPLQFLYPEPAAYSPAHIAVTAASQHVEAARRFVAFVLSDAGQQLLFHPDIRKLPVRAGVYQRKPAGYFNPFEAAAKHPVVYDPTMAQPRLALTNALFDRWLSDHHPRMQALWRALRQLKAGSPVDKAKAVQIATLRQKLSSTPIEETQSQDIELQSGFTRRRQDVDANAHAKRQEQDWSDRFAERYREAEKLVQALQP